MTNNQQLNADANETLDFLAGRAPDLGVVVRPSCWDLADGERAVAASVVVANAAIELAAVMLDIDRDNMIAQVRAFMNTA